MYLASVRRQQDKLLGQHVYPSANKLHPACLRQIDNAVIGSRMLESYAMYLENVKRQPNTSTHLPVIRIRGA